MKKGLMVLMICLIILVVGIKVSFASGPVRPIEDESVITNTTQDGPINPISDDGYTSNGPVRPIGT